MGIYNLACLRGYMGIYSVACLRGGRGRDEPQSWEHLESRVRDKRLCVEYPVSVARVRSLLRVNIYSRMDRLETH